MGEYVFEGTIKSVIAKDKGYSIKFNGNTVVRKNNTNYIVAYEESEQSNPLQAILLSEEDSFFCKNNCVANLFVSNIDGRFKVTIVNEGIKEYLSFLLKEINNRLEKEKNDDLKKIKEDLAAIEKKIKSNGQILTNSNNYIITKAELIYG